MSDGCGTYAKWPLHVWAATPEQARRLNELTDVVATAVSPSGALPEDGDQVEFVIAPFFGSARFAEIVAALPKVRVVQTMTAGVDDMLPLVPEGVTLCDARGAHDISVAEWALMVILGALRGMPRYAIAQSERRWAFWRDGGELHGSRVLIVGFGAVGAAIGERVEAFGATVTAVARTPRDGVRTIGELPAMLPDADIVILATPLTPDTRGLVDKDFLAAMKDGALLVNAARGLLVDTDALVAELSTGRLSCATDVTDPEPLPEDHPLWALPNFLLTPHIGSQSSGMVKRVEDVVVAQAERYRDGRTLENVVTDGY